MPLLCFCKNEALISASHELCTGAASQQKNKKNPKPSPQKVYHCLAVGSNYTNELSF